MKANGLVLGACMAFAVSSAAYADVRIESLTPPLELTIVGWNAFDKDSASELEPAGIEFSNALYSGYNDLSIGREAAPDPKDAEHFNHKARTAARRSEVLPDEPTDRDLSDRQRDVFASALNRLRDSFDRGGREEAAADAALAQVSYDCWIEATEYADVSAWWGDREADAKACRGEFESALARVNQSADYALTEVTFPMMVAMPPAPEGYLVYFEWDTTALTPAGQAGLQEGIRSALARNTGILLVGHADRSGASAYNQSLSEKRALIVVQAMTDAGIERARISWDAVGETRPLVPTADGVREQANRVVVIDLM